MIGRRDHNVSMPHLQYSGLSFLSCLLLRKETFSLGLTSYRKHRDVPLRRRATCIHPFSSRTSERGVSVVWCQVTCYGTTDVVSSRQPSARQRAICAIFQAPASSLSVSWNGRS